MGIDLREPEVQTDAGTLPNGLRVSREMLRKDAILLKNIQVNRCYIAQVHPLIASFRNIKAEIEKLAGMPGIFLCKEAEGYLAMYGFGYSFDPYQLVNYEAIT
jgi:hypothetical protein